MKSKLKIETEKKAKQIVAYVRLSSREQAENTHALEQQIARVRDAGAQKIFQDIQSGSKDDRPALNELMTLVRNREVDEVIITRIDRLARSLPKLRECVDIFLESGVNLKFIDQQIDFSTPQGKLMANILGALAEWETDMLSDRVKHGKQHRRNQKKSCASYPWAYKTENDKYVLDKTPFLCLLDDRPENYEELSQPDIEPLPGLRIDQLARDCIDIFLQEKGVSRALRVIFAKYGISKTKAKKSGHDRVFFFSPTGLTRWLTNLVLCGHTVYNKRETVSKGKRKPNDRSDWQIIRDTHPDERLMSDEEAAEIERILKFNSRLGHNSFNQSSDSPDAYKPYAYQTGLVFCAECGSKCTSKRKYCTKKTYAYFACRHSCKGCGNTKSTRKDKIEEALTKKLLETSTTVEQTGTPSEPSPPAKSKRLKQLEAKLKGLEQISGYDPDLESLKAKTRQEIAEEVNPFTSDNSLNKKTATELIKAGNNLAVWYTLSNDEKVKIYPKLVQRVMIRNGEIESITLHA